MATISVLGKNIQLEFTGHKVKLTNNDELVSLLSQNAEASTDALVAAIRQAFHQANNREIDISPASMSVEIWAHMYTEHFAGAIKNLSTFGLIDNIADKVIGHCEVIDMGESGHDNNRFIWDTLSHFKSRIASHLPKG